MTNVSNSNRLFWLDWMKTLAMFFIIAGHCCVSGYKYIYVFSVPCFFILSGFLTKHEENKVFWKKLWWNLIVPMSIIFLVNTVVQFAVQIAKGTFRMEYIYQTPLLGLVGMQGNDYKAGGLKALWFVYTLVLCKIIFQYLPKKNSMIWLVVLNCVMLALACFVSRNTTKICNSYVNVLLAMPFFCIGNVFRFYKKTITTIPLKWMPILISSGVIAIWLCGSYNDIVMLYRCYYGSSMILCFIGAIFGTATLYAVSRLLEQIVPHYEVVTVIGGGTLIILGFHFVIIQIINQVVHIPGFWQYLESLLILLAFIPVIRFTEKYMPILYGKFRKTPKQ